MQVNGDLETTIRGGFGLTSDWPHLHHIAVKLGLRLTWEHPENQNLRRTVPFVTAHLEIFHCMHHPVIPKSDLYFTFCSIENALSKRTSK